MSVRNTVGTRPTLAEIFESTTLVEDQPESLLGRLSLARNSPSASVTSCVFAKSLVLHFQPEQNPDNRCK